MIAHALTCSHFSSTLYFHIFLSAYPLSNRQIPRISQCIHAELHSHYHWRSKQTVPVHSPKANLSLPAMKHTTKNAVTELTCVSYSSLNRATWNHRSGKYVWKHLQYVYFLKCFPRHFIPQNITNALQILFHQSL